MLATVLFGLVRYNCIEFFGRFPAGRAVLGFAAASVLRYSPHWLTPPATSLTRFATRTSYDVVRDNSTLFRQNRTLP
ncbi:MAG: hypothetical protein JNM36_08840 [Chitinophagales bacterium]|nr:hypothetical protein [Chitinophagales bacterium]